MTEETPALGGTEVHDLWSDEVGDTFRVFLGACGEAPRITLVVADGNGLFGLAVDTIRLMQIPALVPSVLVVGVGYPDAVGVADTVDVRARDLAPTHWPEHFPGSGGGGRYLAFLRDSLLPWVEHRVPGCSADTVYFGHSLGGLFGVTALLDESPPFTRFVLSSPSLFWDRYTVFDREESRAALAGDLCAHAFFGIGALETDEGRRLEGRNLPDGHRWKPPRTRLDMVADLVRFTDRLSSRGYAGLDLSVAVYPEEFHATVPAIVLTHAMRKFFFARD